MTIQGSPYAEQAEDAKDCADGRVDSASCDLSAAARVHAAHSTAELMFIYSGRRMDSAPVACLSATSVHMRQTLHHR